MWRYWNYAQLCSLINAPNMPSFPVVEVGNEFAYTPDQCVERAKGLYHKTKNHIQGIVIRSRGFERYSFTVFNRQWLCRRKSSD
jgi:hypothetical protein